MNAENILGNPDFLAISYGGYREKSREIQPTVEQLKEDMKILWAANIRILRTYNTHFEHASNVLKAIRLLKEEDPNFEMYVMLGAWIDCENAWTPWPNHYRENEEANVTEIDRAVKMAIEYPDIVKVIAVGNEAMVKWATSYYVQASVILRWVNYLQDLKNNGQLSEELWITSSDNFASWGGGDPEYHTEALEDLIRAVDFVSVHTYPMHDTHYNPRFWGVSSTEKHLSDRNKVHSMMIRARDYAISQFEGTKRFVQSIDSSKPVHIGETGWASRSNGFYGSSGSKATDEYKEGLYYHMIRDWSTSNGISCFYFEAFDEPWKDAVNPEGSENHFGLFTVEGKAKYALWYLVDQGVFQGYFRGGNEIIKTYDGDEEKLLQGVMLPEISSEL